MKNKFLVLLAALSIALTPLAAAAEISSDGLTPSQRAEIEAQVAQTKAQNLSGNSSTSAAQAVTEWVEVGKGLGSGLAAGAKEMGVVVNDFAKTDVGRFTMFVIFFKVMGSTIIHLVAGFLWFAIMGGIWAYYFSKLWAPANVVIEYNTEGKKTKKTITKNPLVYNQYDEGRLDGYRFIGVGIGALIAVVGFILTFSG